MDAEALTNVAARAGFFPFFAIDGVVLPRQIVEVFDRGEQAKVPVLAGFNSGEIRSLRALMPAPAADAVTYEQEIRARYADLADEFLALYPSSNLEESMLATTRDALYGWTSQRLVIKQTAAGVRSFLYLFDHGYPAADSRGLHAFHASELPYVFGTADRTPARWPAVPTTPGETQFTNAMLDYWTSFARTGTPSAATQPPWPAYGSARAYYGVRGCAACEGAPHAGHVRAQRRGRLPAPRQGRHPMALERRARLAALARRGAVMPVIGGGGLGLAAAGFLADAL